MATIINEPGTGDNGSGFSGGLIIGIIVVVILIILFFVVGSNNDATDVDQVDVNVPAQNDNDADDNAGTPVFQQNTTINSTTTNATATTTR